MLDEVMDFLNNYFIEKRIFGEFEIEDNTIEIEAQEGQYFAIRGSVFNDGVYQYPCTSLHDEQFKGAIWLLRPPKDFLNTVKDIEEWQGSQSLDSPAFSPFQSESFGGYSYTKGTKTSVYSGGWQDVFGSRLARWRKI